MTTHEQRRIEREQRADAMVMRYLLGASMQEIAEESGVTRQRVSIIMREFYDTGVLAMYRRRTRAAFADLPDVDGPPRTLTEVRQRFPIPAAPGTKPVPPIGAVLRERQSGMSWEEIARAHGLPRNARHRIRNAARRWSGETEIEVD